jgi:hypothetical protein
VSSGTRSGAIKTKRCSAFEASSIALGKERKKRTLHFLLSLDGKLLRSRVCRKLADVAGRAGDLRDLEQRLGLVLDSLEGGGGVTDVREDARVLDLALKGAKR